MPHRTRPRVTRHHAVHVTLHLAEGLPSLRRAPHTDLLLRLFSAERDKLGFRLVHFAIRTNHVHLVCEADSSRALSRGVQRLTSRFARRMNERLGRCGRVVRDRFHAVVIATPRHMRNVLRYVLLNAHKDRARSARLRHALAGGPRPPFQGGIDPWTSAYYFDGFADVGPVPPEPPLAPPLAFGERVVDPTGPPVTEPRSWLLQVGWRRHGLIDTGEYDPPAR